ncbi:MAG: PASTA domain-containing protein [Clostridia bacterium]|nr:PASTA domain-containing protein [Clostridia bacterium]
MATICLGCLNPLPDGDDVCRICGFSADSQNPENALPVRTVLQEHYIVGRLVHAGSDSLFYLGYDKAVKEPCFIQEYYPGNLCRRADGRVEALIGSEYAFEGYEKAFRSTMRSLARMKELPNMIPIYDIFEENGTCYAVSDYCEGETLSKKIARAGGRIPWQEARPLFMMLMTCVEQLAAANIQHLAICPDNILISEDGKPHLRGFSIAAARRVGSDLQPHLATGYAAPEQYDAGSQIGEATDVYGIAATIFRTVTGNEPPAGNNRAADSDDLFMSAEIADELTQQVCIALFNALQVDTDERTATVTEFHKQLSMEPGVSALIDEGIDTEPKKKKSKKSLNLLLIILGVLVALGLLIGTVVVLLSGDRQNGNSSEPVTSLPSLSSTTTTTKRPNKHSAPSLVGKYYFDLREDKDCENFNIVVGHKEYSSKDKGVVLSQDPAPGTSLDKGDTITIIVSLGKDDSITVPDLSGWKEEHAKLYLEALGFKVEIDKLLATDVEKGYVEGTDPAAGTVKLVGDTIHLRVSYVEQTAEEPNEDEPIPDISIPDDFFE